MKKHAVNLSHCSFKLMLIRILIHSGSKYARCTCNVFQLTAYYFMENVIEHVFHLTFYKMLSWFHFGIMELSNIGHHECLFTPTLEREISTYCSSKWHFCITAYELLPAIVIFHGPGEFPNRILGTKYLGYSSVLKCK